MKEDDHRKKGKVKFYNQRKNYGFIIPEDGGEDLYFKGWDVDEGWLQGGETVKFTREPLESHNGGNPRARNIVKVKKFNDYLKNGLDKFKRGFGKKWGLRIVSLSAVIVALVLIYMFIPWSRLVAHFSGYQIHLQWLSLALLFSFFMGVAGGAAEKKRKKKTKVKGEIEVPEGAEVRIKGSERRRKKPPSKTIIKWVSIAGILLAVLGLVIGSFDFTYGAFSVVFGGVILGLGPGLLIKRYRRKY